MSLREEQPSLADGGRAFSTLSARARFQRQSCTERGMGSKSSTLRSLETMNDRQIAWATNFYLFVLAYAMSFNAAVTSFDVQNFILGRQVQSIGTAVLMTFIVLASTVSGSIAGVMGPKKVVTLSCILMLLYFVGLGLASLFPKDDPMQWPFFMIGALGCGLSVALLAAGLGPWVDRTAVVLCEEDPELEFSEVSSQLLANFAAISAAVDVAFMLLLTGLREFVHASYSWVVLCYGILSLAGILLIRMAREPPFDEEQHSKKKSLGKLARQELSITWSYYKDPRALLLAIPPLTVGVFSAWKSFNIVSILEMPGSIGDGEAGMVNLVQAATTVIFAKMFERLIPRVGTNPILALGSILLVVAPLLYLFTGLAGNGHWILLFFIIAGMVWSVLETSFRVVLLDHFPADMASTAFAAYTMQLFLGQAVFYFLSGAMSDKAASTLKCIIIVGLAVLMMPSLKLADGRKDKIKAAVNDEKEETGPQPLPAAGTGNV